MNVTRARMFALIAAAGAANGVANAGVTCTTGNIPATGPSVVHISGATLLENFLRSKANTVDYIDVDGNGVARSYIPSTTQQLAPFVMPTGAGDTTTWAADQDWIVVYSSVGSTAGFQELVDFGRGWVEAPGTTSGTHMLVSRRTTAYFNRNRYIQNGLQNDDNTDPEFLLVGNIFNSANPAGVPVRTVTTNSPVGVPFTAVYTNIGTASDGGNQGLCAELEAGFTVDVAPLDVPTSYGTLFAGTGPLDNTPLQTGYGNNTFTSVDKDGTTTFSGTRTHKLVTLTGGANLLGQLGLDGFGNPIADNNTVFDTPIAHAPVAAIVNFGVGKSEMKMSDLRHLSAAGRMSTGENLNFSARGSGSGTRAAWATSIGIDPSFSIGETVGITNNGQRTSGGVSGEFDRPGLFWLPANKNGSGNVDTTVVNCRTCLGMSGAERMINNGYLTSGSAEVLAVQNDIPAYGGTEYSRPFIDDVLDNNANGYVIAGPAVLATFGDPKSAPENKGGLGWLEPWTDANNDTIAQVGEFRDINGNGVRDAVETRPATLYPAMRNVEAAAYMNNIIRSIDAFEGLPGSDSTIFTPGELLAGEYVLMGAIDNVQQSSPAINPTTLVTNPALNQSLQDFTRANSVYTNHSWKGFAYATGPSPSAPLGFPLAPQARAGKVPSRIVAANTYSDQGIDPAGDQYVIQDSSTVAAGQTEAGRLNYGSNLPLRNLVAGDFNADGLRNINDAAEMVNAWRQRTGGPAWVSPVATGDLAALSTSMASLGGIANADVSQGVACIELLGDYNNDGSFNAFDLRYWADGFAIATTGINAGKLDRKAGFTALDNALATATSGVDNNVFNTVLKTGKSYAAGDARGDIANALGLVGRGFQPIGADGYLGTVLAPSEKNVVDAFDIDYVYKQFKTNYNPAIIGGEANWSEIDEAVSFDLSADMTGDLIVNQADVVELVTVILGTSMGDVNLDGTVNAADTAIVNASISTPPATPSWANGDLNGDGVVNAADLALVVPACAADFNGVNGVTVQDIFDFLTAWLAGNPTANFNGVNGVTVQDIFDFLTAWLAGC